jgi:hypothetical protein
LGSERMESKSLTPSFSWDAICMSSISRRSDQCSRLTFMPSKILDASKKLASAHITKSCQNNVTKSSSLRRSNRIYFRYVHEVAQPAYPLSIVVRMRRSPEVDPHPDACRWFYNLCVCRCVLWMHGKFSVHLVLVEPRSVSFEQSKRPKFPTASAVGLLKLVH